MPKIVVAEYATTAHFKIPKGIDLEDKTVVKWWGTKWLVLYIHFVDETREPLKIEAEFEPELDCKYANSKTIEDGCDYGYSDDEEDEEECEECEKCPHPKVDEEDNLCHDCYHKTCEEGECYCGVSSTPTAKSIVADIINKRLKLSAPA